MKSILLIEDNADILANLTEFFELEGYRIFSTNTEKRGIELARKFLPDLIICNSPKPGIDGHAVLKLIINTTETTGIPFIFCSSLCEKNDRLDALKFGADDYMIKPFEQVNILHTVKNNIATGSRRQKCLQ